jgi:hypothetical protein
VAWALTLTVFVLPVTAACLVGAALGLGPEELAASRALHLYVGFGFAAASWGAWLARRQRVPTLACAQLGLLVLFAWLFAWQRCHFSGRVSVGLGEPAGAWSQVRAGPWASELTPTVELLQVPTEPKGNVRLQIDGNLVEARLGSRVRFSPAGKVHVLQWLTAPAVVLREVTGRVLHQGYVKIDDRATADEYLNFGLLPHRFYFARAGDGRALKVHVMRGKLTIAQQRLEPGETVDFDGMSLLFTGTAPWVAADVTLNPATAQPVLALLVLFVGGPWSVAAYRAASRWRQAHKSQHG